MDKDSLQIDIDMLESEQDSLIESRGFQRRAMDERGA